MGSELEDRLHASAPEVAPLVGLAAHRERILAEARMRRSRRVRVWIGSAAASVVLIGGGSVAIAGGDHLSPWGWFADNSFTIERSGGADCFVGIRVQWEGVAEDDPMVRDARQVLSSIDLTILDIADRLAEDRALNDTLQPPEKRSDDELRLTAMATVAATETLDELVARGYSMRPGHEVSITSDGTGCR